MKRKNLLRLLLVALLAITGLSASAQGKPVTLEAVNMDLPAALKQVERQSDYYKFNYNVRKLGEFKVTASIRGLQAPAAVRKLIDGLPLIMTEKGRYIDIKAAEGRKAESGARRGTGISGIVTDEDGEPLAGVNIRQQDGNAHTVTDIDGRFMIATDAERMKLRLTYVGMKEAEVTATNGIPVKVAMIANQTLLDEVVVTGYQEVKKEKMTGSVTTVNSAKLEERYNQNLLSNLEGQVAGLSTYGGKPVIRGTGTLYGSTAPLLVVDGMPIEGAIEDLNPYDIESVNVLKDAAAAAIYGARAANGIIVVTTKNAKKKGKVDVDFSANVTWYEKKNVDYEDNYYMTPEQQVGVESDYYEYYFLSGEKENSKSEFERYLRNGYDISPLKYAYYQFSNGDISREQLESTKASLAKNNFARDLADNMLHRQVIQQYNLSLRSSSDVSRNNVVVNYKHDNVGKFNHKNEWLNVYYKGSFDLAKWLTATVSINGVYSTVKEFGGDYNTRKIYDPFSYSPYVPYKNPDGSIRAFYYGGYGNEYPEFWGPVQEGITDMIVDPKQEAKDNVQTTRRQEMRYHADMLFKILPGLTANAQFIYEVTTSRMRNYANENSFAAREMKNGFATFENGKVVYKTPENGGLLRTENVDGNYWTLRGQLNYSRTFGKHDIAAIAGTEFRQTKKWGEKQFILGYDDQLQSSATHTIDFNALRDIDNYWKIGDDICRLGTTQFATDNGIVPEVRHRYASGYFNLTYTYDERYNLFGSFRKDYADVYGLNAKFRGKPLWSVGAGWNLHNEEFMHDFTWLNFLKLRYSYGVTGNIYQGATSYMTASSGGTDRDTNKPYGTIVSPANPNLRWEQNRTHNVGVDFSMMGYRLRGSLDYYRKEGRDIFGNKILDATTGFSSMNANVASILNKGIELTLGYDWIRSSRGRDLSWSTNLTLTYNKNEVTYVENPATSAYDLINTPYKKGYPVNALWAFHFAGIDSTTGQEGQQLYDDGFGGKSHDVLYNGDASALHFAGQTDPKVIIGIDNQIKWKGFSLGFLLSYYGGHKMFCLPFDDQFEGGFYGPLKAYYLDAWTPDKPTDVPAIGKWAHSTSTDSAPQYSDRALHDADFIKFRNIVFGYDLPSSLLRHVGLNRCSLRFQINDPKAIWHKDKTDFDPETGGLRNPSSYVFGLNINI